MLLCAVTTAGHDTIEICGDFLTRLPVCCHHRIENSHGPT